MAGALYAIIVFLIGFILGTIRVLPLAPRLGETTAVIIEAPIILMASWFVCRWCVRPTDGECANSVNFLLAAIAPQRTSPGSGLLGRGSRCVRDAKGPVSRGSELVPQCV
jgi:hypothetical protein